jgi:hypothetical protein
VTLSASTLGLFRVHVFGGRARDLLPDCPVAITVVAGGVSFFATLHCLQRCKSGESGR